MENKESRFRIKEVAINDDGTNIWFYPQFAVILDKTIGKLWWKKTIETKRWSNFFKVSDNGYWNTEYAISHDEYYDHKYRDNDIAAFRKIEDAQDFIKDIAEKRTIYSKESKEKKYKILGGQYDSEENKIHPVNI